MTWHMKFRDKKNRDQLSPAFQEWVLKQDDDMKFDMMDTVRRKKDKFMFGRLVDLFCKTPEEEGGLDHREIEKRYVISVE